MDYKKLQQTLFDIEPVDYSRDKAILSELAGSPARVAVPDPNSLEESTSYIPTPVSGDKSILDLMSLAGIPKSAQSPVSPIMENVLGRAASAAGNVTSTVGKDFRTGQKSSTLAGDALSGAFSGSPSSPRKSASGAAQDDAKLIGGKTGREFAKILGINETNVNLFARGFDRIKRGQEPGPKEKMALGEGFSNLMKMDDAGKRKIIQQFIIMKKVGEEAIPEESSNIENELSDLKGRLKNALRKKLGGE
jgi:hypothetical protein